MDKKYLHEDELKIGMRCTPEQLRHIYDKRGDKEGTLVFIGKKQTKAYDKWFMQENTITPIFHSSMELEEGVVFDDELLCC